MSPTSGFEYIRFKSQASGIGNREGRPWGNQRRIHNWNKGTCHCAVVLSVCQLTCNEACGCRRIKTCKQKQDCEQVHRCRPSVPLVSLLSHSAHSVIRVSQVASDQLWAVASGGRKCSKRVLKRGISRFVCWKRECVRRKGGAGRGGGGGGRGGGGEKAERVWEGAVIC